MAELGFEYGSPDLSVCALSTGGCVCMNHPTCGTETEQVTQAREHEHSPHGDSFMQSPGWMPRRESPEDGWAVSALSAQTPPRTRRAHGPTWKHRPAAEAQSDRPRPSPRGQAPALKK